jgi:hypothetical protein
MLKKISSIVFALALVAGVGFSGMFAKAATTITSPATANISADSSTGASVALPAITINEGVAGDVQTGVKTWALPSGFVFNTASSADVSLTGAGLAASSSAVSFPDSTHFSINITSSSTAPGSLTVGSVTPLMVKAASGTPLASGNITLSSGNINGVTSATNFGTLTKVPGAANKLSFTTEPMATSTVNSAFSAGVSVMDQFGNTVATDNGRNITLSSNLVSGTAGTLSGTLTMPDTNGVANFTGLSFNQPAVITLSVQSTGLTGATSTQVNVGNSTTTPLMLADGTLVQLQGNPTIYIVQNGKLVVYQQGKNGNGEDGNNNGGGNGDNNSGSHGSSGNTGHEDSSVIIPSNTDSNTIVGTVTTNSVVSDPIKPSNPQQDNNSQGNGHNGNGNSKNNGKGQD